MRPSVTTARRVIAGPDLHVPGPSRPPSHDRVEIQPRYGLLTVAYLAAIYWMSSLPDLGPAEGGPLAALAFNLSHVPLFAGLAFCVLRSLGGAWRVTCARYGLAFLASGAGAAADEWHQAHVPGRHGSTGDLLLDLAGIGAMLILLRVHTWRKERQRR